MKKFDMKELLEGVESIQRDQWEVCKHHCRTTGQKIPGMVVMSVQPTDASKSYMRNKERYFKKIGIPFTSVGINETDPEIIKSAINDVANDKIDWNGTCNIGSEANPVDVWPVVGGMILQLPLPRSIEDLEQELVEHIPHSTDHYLDADGLCSPTIYELMSPGVTGQFTCLPCTPKGIMMIIDRYLNPESSISELIVHTLNKNWGNMLNGKSVTIVGRGKLVGKPLSMLCINAGATVTVCNSKTPLAELARATQKADIIIYATGKIEGFGSLNCSSVKPQLVIDCGIGYNKDGKLAGDFKPDDIFYDNVTYTPVPGGVGPMTVAMLCQNFLEIMINGK